MSYQVELFLIFWRMEMNYKRLNRAAMRIAQMFTVMFTCALLFVANLAPANAAPMNNTGANSDLTKGSERLDDVQKKSEEILRNPPMSLDRVQDESNKGLNEVQGAADIQDMNRPSNSQQATSIQEKAEQVLEKVKGEK
jgi:hypothetical protein